MAHGFSVTRPNDVAGRAFHNLRAVAERPPGHTPDIAEADTRVARANAEKRRAEAIAMEQEMKADVAAKQAALVKAEAEVPNAMAEAFRAGNMHSS